MSNIRIPTWLASESAEAVIATVQGAADVQDRRVAREVKRERNELMELRRAEQMSRLGLTLSDWPEFERLKNKGFLSGEAADLLLRSKRVRP